MDPTEFAARTQRDWDARADCNAAWFVDYGHWRDEAEIDASGEREVEALLDGLDEDTLRRARVLEIGCGIARLLRPLAARVAHAVGVDVSPRMLEHARRRIAGVANIELGHCDGSGVLPFPDDSFDAVYSAYVFEHLPAVFTWRYLEEAARVLKPGGWLRFQFTTPLQPTTGPAPASPEELAQAATEIVDQMPDGVAELAHGPTIEGEPIELETITARLRDLGLTIDTTRPTGANNVAVFARAAG